MESSRRNELKEIQHQVGLITDESLESTRRMLNMMEESEDAGRQTLESLDIQKEKISRIEKGMDNINADMTEAEKSLSRLKRCCNICSVPWSKVNSQYGPDENSESQIEKNCQVIVDQPQRRNDENSIPGNTSNGYITRITNDAAEDEMESNLCHVNSILGNLKNMAVDMNSELIEQNEQIRRINTKGDVNTIRLNHVNVTANTLLKS